MPRKRKTRLASQSRPKPTMPDGDEGRDLEKSLRREKLRVLLQDFDTEVDSMRKKLKNDSDNIIRHMQVIYNCEIMKMPRELKEMKVTDYVAAGGLVDAKSVLEIENLCQSVVKSIDDRVNAISSKSKKAVSASGGSDGGTAKGRATRRPTTQRGRKALASNTSMNMGPPPPPTTGRTRRTTRQRGKLGETPAQFGGPSHMGWETPLITPKFDPRLPMTPATARGPKPHEQMMSLAGSPVMHKCDASKCSTVYNRKQTVVKLGDKEVDLDQARSLDDDTVDKLQQLWRKLGDTIQLSQSKQN